MVTRRRFNQGSPRDACGHLHSRRGNLSDEPRTIAAASIRTQRAKRSSAGTARISGLP